VPKIDSPSSKAVDLLYQSGIAYCQQFTADKQHVYVWNAQAHTSIQSFINITASFQYHQTFKPELDALQALAVSTASKFNDDSKAVDLALLFPYKNKQQTLFYMAQAMQQLKSGGRIIMACENKYGAKSYQHALASLAGHADASSKSKCRIFSAYKHDGYDECLAQTWLQAGAIQKVQGLDLYSQPGLFSWNRADLGSQILLSHLPQLSGKGMDLCCGYGLLSVHLLQTSADISCLHMLDAEQQAILCAKKNTQDWISKCQYDCLDATQDDLPSDLDWLVCNPPFHTGQQREVALGQTIVAKACQSLKRGGEIWVVANRQLPYEHIFEQHLRQHNIIQETQGFKIIHGVR